MTSDAGRAPLRGLYAITPECADTAELLSRVERALAGGAALVQYRAKDAPPELALEQARALARVCRGAGVPLIVNDSVELALASGAHGVHLGRDDAGVREARRAMPHGIIGVSCYDDPRIAARAAAEGADYVAIGSVFASGTKPLARPAALADITAARATSGLPVAAIGGITPDNAPRAIAAGADMLAVISSLFDAGDIEAAARAFARLFASPRLVDSDVRSQPRTF
jgi:thiamine-phosphate pyrophosphorylase